MKDWVFPSVTFLIFLYGLCFIMYQVHDYQNANISSFQDSKQDMKTDDINSYLREISKSFR